MMAAASPASIHWSTLPLPSRIRRRLFIQLCNWFINCKRMFLSRRVLSRIYLARYKLISNGVGGRVSVVGRLTSNCERAARLDK